MFKNQLLLLLCIAIVNCGPSTRKLSERTKRMLENITVDTSASWEPLRVSFEYVTDADAETKTFLDSIFSIAGVFFQKHLLIRRSSSKLIVPQTAVEDFKDILTLPESMIGKQYDADLVFFVSTMNDSSDDTLAACEPTEFDSKTKRPIFAGIVWNMGQTTLPLSNAGFEAQLATAVHEMIHGLGFVEDLFSKFYDSVDGSLYSNGGTTTSESIVMLLTPRVVAQAQKHFGCTDITGLPMENEGGDGTAGSHWERAVFYNEIMTGSDMVSSFAFTDFTLQFLQDTGFYRLATYTPDILTWGYQQGCSFFSQQCNGGTFKEFCTQEGDSGCQITKYGIGTCGTDNLANNCSYYQVNPILNCMDASATGYTDNTNTYDYFGFESMCIEGGFSSSASITPHPFNCYKFTCGDKFLITVNGETVDCTSGGTKTLSGLNGNITCPDNVKQFCANEDDCPNQCNKRGFCMKGLCTCIGNYYGVGCELEGCATVRNGKDCVSTCPTGQYHNTNINYCIGCPGNCATCSAYNVCTICNQGYELRGGFCDYLSYNSSFDGLLKIIAITIYLLVI